MNSREVYDRTEEAVTAMHLAVVRYCSEGDTDSACTVLEMAKLLVDCAMKIMAGCATEDDVEQWKDLISL